MEKRFLVPGASCGHCEAAITKAISSLPGSKGFTFDLSSKLLVLPESLDEALALEALAKAGYEAKRA
jgi:copper chaperone CopZ